jgi:hypothetical protein
MRPVVGNLGGSRYAGAAAVRSAAAMSEVDLQTAICDLARVYRWRSFHARPAVTGRGYRTAVAGDGVGFPDLLLVRDRRLIVAELKSADGDLTPAQQAWLLAFEHVAERYIWRPKDLTDGSIGRVLR